MEESLDDDDDCDCDDIEDANVLDADMDAGIG
jgi:hypothetical protein